MSPQRKKASRRRKIWETLFLPVGGAPKFFRGLFHFRPRTPLKKFGDAVWFLLNISNCCSDKDEISAIAVNLFLFLFNKKKTNWQLSRKFRLYRIRNNDLKCLKETHFTQLSCRDARRTKYLIWCYNFIRFRSNSNTITWTHITNHVNMNKQH